MKEALLGLLGSKKFWYVLIGAAVKLFGEQLGLDPSACTQVMGLFGGGAVAQGVADHGKEAAKEVAAATDGKSPAEKASALEAM